MAVVGALSFTKRDVVWDQAGLVVDDDDPIARSLGSFDRLFQPLIMLVEDFFSR